MKYFLLRDYNNLTNKSHQNTFDIFGCVWWSSRPYSTTHNKDNLAETLTNGNYKILRHLKCNGVFRCANEDCHIISPTPTSKVNPNKDYLCQCTAVMVHIQCEYTAGFWILRHDDKLYGAIIVGSMAHGHPINTFCKTHLNKKELAILTNLIQCNPFKSTRQLLNIPINDNKTTLMANPQMANIDKVAVIKKGILKGMYQDTINAISLYQRDTGHLLKICTESTTIEYADITYQSKDMKEIFQFGKYKGFSTDVTFKVVRDYNCIISMVNVPHLKRSVPILFTFIRGNKEQEYYNHFNTIALMILEEPNCTYKMFREQYRASMDWSRAQYNGFVYVYKTIAVKHFADKFDPEHIHAAVCGCKFHFFRNARKNFADQYKESLTKEEYVRQHDSFMFHIYNLYNTASKRSFEHGMTQITITFPKMESWIEYYRDSVFKFMINNCFLPLSDQYIYEELDSTTNRNEGFHSELYKMGIKYVSLLHFAHLMDILTKGFNH